MTALNSARVALPPGFGDPVMDAQKTFRAVLTALSRPGTIVPAPVLPAAPQPVYQSTVAAGLTLLDLDTPLWLDRPARSDKTAALFRFHCGCPLVDDPSQAAFGLVSSGKDLPDLTLFPIGTAEYPDRSATVLIQVEALASAESAESGVTLSGPGIKDRHRIKVTGLADSFWKFWRDNGRLFPRGLDALLVSPVSFCGLPRTVRAEEE